MRTTPHRLLLSAAALLVLAPTSAFAQFAENLGSADAQTISEIRVMGNQGITESQVVGRSGLAEGESLQPAQLSEKVAAAIRSLWESKWFSDVQVEIEYPDEDEAGKIVLVFTVAERPLLREIEIEGADEVTEEDLRILLDIHPGQMFGQPDVERMRQKILRKYREEGFMMAEVRPILETDEKDGKTTLVFSIREGRKVTVRDVRFHGNDSVDEADLAAALGSQVDHWWSSGEFREEQVERDLDSIRAHYGTEGYLDADVVDHKVIYCVDSSFRFYVGRLAATPAATDTVLERLDAEVRSGGPLAEIAAQAVQIDDPYYRRFRARRGAVPRLRIETEEDAVRTLNRLLDIDHLREKWLDRIEREEGRPVDPAARRALGPNGERLKIRQDLERRYGLLNYELARTGNEVELEFTVNEGRRYYTGDFSFQDNKVHSTPVLKSRVRLEKGKPFNTALYAQSVQEMYGIYREEGYLFVRVDDRKTYRDSVVDVEIKFTEGKPASIRRVLIEGNTTTKDKVIRREVQLFPGDTYRQSLMERSYREIMQLNYFDEVTPDIRMRPDSDQEVDLLFKVKEKEAGTGQFTAGLAYSQKDYLTGTLGLSIPNCCLGDGQTANVTLEYGEYRKNYSIGFSEPWFLDKPIRVGGTVSYYHYDYDSEDISDITRYGVRGYLGRRLKWPDDYFYVQGDVQIMRHEQGPNFSDDAVVLYTGNETSASITLTRDDKDLPIFPTEGSRVSGMVQWAFAPGDFSFVETELIAKWWWPLVKNLTLGFEGDVGVLDGPAVQYSALYQMGGMLGYQGKLRGYSAGSIGRYRIGRSYLSLSAELTYAVAPQTFYLLAFANAGNVYGDHLDSKAIPTYDELPSPWTEIDPSDLYRDVGFGFRVVVPMLGIIGFDWGWPLDPGELSSGKRADDVGSYQVNFIISQGF
ncbi:MAG: BamA/TamA family outer membrane protein [Fibrobacterales bacterium]|nr:BamA/TamA family outer membrane protein [Fibrobacterales bacterium]MBP5351646.1 BamA/TamA family outer membrane protein [Fibrobacterales bacterium]